MVILVFFNCYLFKDFINLVLHPLYFSLWLWLLAILCIMQSDFTETLTSNISVPTTSLRPCFLSPTLRTCSSTLADHQCLRLSLGWHVLPWRVADAIRAGICLPHTLNRSTWWVKSSRAPDRGYIVNSTHPFYPKSRHSRGYFLPLGKKTEQIS